MGAIVRSIVTWVAGIAIAAAMLFGLVHVVVPPINPAQRPPRQHWDPRCAGCHIVSSSVGVRDV